MIGASIPSTTTGVGVDVGVGVKVGVAVGPNEIFRGPRLQEDVAKDIKRNSRLSTTTLFLFTIASFRGIGLWYRPA
jgi:hypothetical protein